MTFKDAVHCPPKVDQAVWKKVYNAADSRIYLRVGKDSVRSARARASGETWSLALSMLEEQRFSAKHSLKSSVMAVNENSFPSLQSHQTATAISQQAIALSSKVRLPSPEAIFLSPAEKDDLREHGLYWMNEREACRIELINNEKEIESLIAKVCINCVNSCVTNTYLYLEEATLSENRIFLRQTS